jgi:signal peptidase I
MSKVSTARVGFLHRHLERLPRPLRIAIDWAVTIIGAIAIVLALKAWVVNPYRIPSSSMEPTLHCARPSLGCRAHFADRVLACRICLDFTSPSRGQIVVFNTPPEAAEKCGEGGTFVKRLIGLPGDTVTERKGTVLVNGTPLDEPYVEHRDTESGTWHVPEGDYFFMGDNRAASCDSRLWGPVPRRDLIGTVFFTYWPPNRIGFP